jgi:hypothetical protein
MPTLWISERRVVVIVFLVNLCLQYSVPTMYMLFLVLLLGLAMPAASATKPDKPHIFMVIVDDFGWADAGWHRKTPSREVVTPTMDALVKEGVELNRHYVHMMCTEGTFLVVPSNRHSMTAG